MSKQIAVIGLGYVGLPVALAFAKRYPGTIGFDIKRERVDALREHRDSTREVSEAELRQAKLRVTHDEADLRGANFFVIAVPTPIDDDKRPDLRALLSASATVGRVMSRGSVVVFESTVYPGVTEDICVPVLAQASGLRPHEDFKVGYSPERINPGDREHALEKVIKVVSGEDAESLETIAAVYGSIIDAGVYRAPSIKVAEAAKVIENTQRDLNIALMNELAMIFDRMEIDTRAVLDAAGTKWNFLRFLPGLVGGHCIGVDPYYLTTKAEQIGYRPQVILAGRRINDGMGQFLAQRTVKLMINAGFTVKGSRVGVLGLTFKENVPDIRNSRVPDIVHELREFGVAPLVCDPLADPVEVSEEYGLDLTPFDQCTNLDALVLAVAHERFLSMKPGELASRIRPGGVFVDVKSVFQPGSFPAAVAHWRL